MTEKFWDQGAPYGQNGYSFGGGEWVDGTVTRSIEFRMKPGGQCFARGAMEMADGTVYLWTVLNEGREHRLGEPRRLASRSWQSFRDLAHGLFLMEEDCIRPDLMDDTGTVPGYRSQLAAL